MTSTDLPTDIAASSPADQHATGTARVKRGMAEMLKGGVIMDVVTPEQAQIAEDAGAVAVMALERVPADIRAQGGVSRMSDPDMIDGIIAAVSIPVMAKARIGHFVEAQVLQALGVDYVDESEVLTPADYAHHIDKWPFTVPFVCGATNLGEALRRIAEGAAMIRSKGEAGTGDVSNAVTHMRTIRAEIRRLTTLAEDELYVAAKELQAPYELVVEVARPRQPARRPVHRRRHRHPGRRGHDDAARRRGRVRRLRHLQVRRPGSAGRGHRQGHHVLRRPGRARQGLPRPRRGDGRHQRRRRAGRPPARRPRLVTTGSSPRIGVLALQGDVREHLRALDAVGARGVPVRRPRSSPAATAWSCPAASRPRSSSWRPRSTCSSRCERAIKEGLPAYGSCAGMILLADRLVDAPPEQQTIGGLDVTVRRNAFGRQVDSFEADVDFAGFDGRRCTRSSSGRRGSRRSGAGVEVLARVDATAVTGRR